MEWLLTRIRRDVRIRCNTTTAMVAACAAGLGIALAIAPSMRGAPGVTEVLPRAEIPTREIWGIVPTDMRRDSRRRAVLDWAADALAAAGMRPA